MDRAFRDRNIVAAICYIPVISIVISLVVLLVEKDEKFIRFHAFQALIFSVAYYLTVFFLGGLPLIGWLISALLFVVAVAVWILGMMNAYMGRIFKLPLIGDFSEKRVR